MVRGAQIPKKDLIEYSTEEKEERLKTEFELSEEDLDEVRSQRYVIDKVRRAAEKLHENGYDQQITLFNVAALTYEDWDNPPSKESSTVQALGNEYREERDAIENVKDLDITYMHLLRDDVGAYEGNMLEARTHYSNFSNSQEDLLRSVVLPLEIDMDESELLGAYWTDGRFSDSSERYEFDLVGTANDKEWYRDISEEIEKIHNLDVKVIEEEIEGEMKDAREPIKSKRPVIKIDSQAILTWLKDDLKMDGAGGISIPDINWSKENKAGFLRGALAGRGGITQYGNYEFTTGNQEKAEILTQFAQDIGLEPAINVNVHTERGTEQYRFSLNREETDELHSYDFFWNPRHRNRLNAFERGLSNEDIRDAETQQDMQEQLLKLSARLDRTPTKNEFTEETGYSMNDIQSHWKNYSNLARQSDLIPSDSSIGDKLELYHLMRTEFSRVPKMAEIQRLPRMGSTGKDIKFSSLVEKAGDRIPKGRSRRFNPRETQKEQLKEDIRIEKERMEEDKGKSAEELTYKYS